MAKRNMKFGVEIEFFGVTMEVVAQALRRAGIDVAIEGYNHTTRSHWKLVTDASVNSTGTGRTSGNELVSPPLTGVEGLKEVELACKVLAECGAKVDKTCGLHVHHDTTGMTVEHFKNLYRLYYKFYQSIDYMMPPSRRKDEQERRGGYCQPINSDYLNKVLSCTTLSDMIQKLSSTSVDRYRAINFLAFSRHKTIEFRQHSGSTDGAKIVNWIQITHKLIEKACGNKEVELAKDEDWRICDSNWHFRQVLKGDKELEKYAVDRMAYWRAKEKLAQLGGTAAE